MPVTVSCAQCGKEQQVIPARAKTFKFCSYACGSAWRSVNYTGENSPTYRGGERTKVCQHCDAEFSHRRKRPLATFRKQKFCSKACADAGGIRHSGPDNGNWNGNPRTKQRNSKHSAWARKVISRDRATCRKCGAQNVEMQAHHIKPWKTHPELRWDLDNGLTLCAPCHWHTHNWKTENGVNSGKPAADDAGGNPEPSFGRKPVEGATTRGRAYRRWEGACEWCGDFISRRWSDVKGKAHLFCSKQCAGKFKSAHRTYRPMKPSATIVCLNCGADHQVPAARAQTAKFCGHSCRASWWSRFRAHGSNASTSAPHPPSRVMI
jgi:hypothetical protein